MSFRESSKINQSMDLCKLIASVFVVLIHIGLTDESGWVFNCLARFGVPVFFAISGYFSLNADCGRIKKRACHILKIFIVSSVGYFIWQCVRIQIFGNISVSEYLEGILTEANISRWFLIGHNPFAGHLWYLHAILTCYVLLWIYVRFFDGKVNYNVFYILGAVGMLIQIAFGSYTAAAGVASYSLIYRNGLFFGLPMFAAGMFIREYSSVIKEKFRLNAFKEIGLVIFGILLSLIQWKGSGLVEMPVGTLIEVIALMLLMDEHPQILPAKYDRMFKSFGNISLAVYIIHQFYILLINSLSAKEELFAGIKGDDLLMSLTVIALSLVTGIVYDMILTAIEKVKKR